ncbi:TPA: hypothetical protein ACTXXA_002037 [Legionella anisa]
MKQALTGILTTLLLPFTTAASVVIVALLLAMLALFSPVILIGGALWSAGKLSEKFTNWLYPPQNIMTSNHGNGPIITSLSTTGILFFLLIAPVAVGSAATATVVSILLVPALAVNGAYKIADSTINYLYKLLSLNKEEVRVKHSYSILPQDLDESPEDPEDVLNFDPLFRSQATNNVKKIPAFSSEEIITLAHEELGHRTLGCSTSSDET